MTRRVAGSMLRKVSTAVKERQGTLLSDRAQELRVELAGKIAQSIGSLERMQTDIPGLTLHRYTEPTTPACVTYEPSLAVVAQGRKKVEIGRRTLIYDASRFLLTSLDLPVVSQVIEASAKAPYLCMRLKLELPAVGELLSHGDIPAAQGAFEGPAMATGQTSLDLLQACNRLMDLVTTPRDIPFLSEQRQREVIYRILQSEEGQRLRAIATQGDQSQRTARAIAWIKENYAKPLRVDELAQVAGMGVSTLHTHFRALTSMSPLQYQKQLRLHTARQRMLSEGLDAASAAFEVGYGSATQFNREYSRFFGQPPMRDVRTIRSPGSIARGAASDESAPANFAY